MSNQPTHNLVVTYEGELTQSLTYHPDNTLSYEGFNSLEEAIEFFDVKAKELALVYASAINAQVGTKKESSNGSQ